MARFDLISLRKGLRRLRFFASTGLAYATPRQLYGAWWRLRFLFLSKRSRQEAESRADYYFRLPSGAALPASEAVTVGNFRFPTGKKKRLSTYFLDLASIVRLFPAKCRFGYIFGDVDTEATFPAFVKSRPIVPSDGKSLSVLMPLNSVRHFMFVTDHTPWAQKKDAIVFRADILGKPHRHRYLKATYGLPMCDSAEVSANPIYPEMSAPYMPIAQMLEYKFIATLEGNDVATALKWVMSSNSIAVMPRPRIESWFMEAQLIPGVHYIEIAPDYSDLEEKLKYYLTHPDEAEAIIRNANAYTRRFRRPTLEKYTAYLTARRYFRALC